MRSPVAAGAAALALLLAGCTERQRPSPVDPGSGMTVEITAPDDDQTVRPGPLAVVVHGHDEIGRLTQLGVLARSAAVQGGFADSVFVQFSATTDMVSTMHLTMPTVTGATGIELHAVARNATGGEVSSGTVGVIVVPCPVGGCPPAAVLPR